MSRRKRAKEFQHCRKCGRVLSDPDSRVRGYGPICYMNQPTVVQAALEKAGQLTFPREILEFKR